MERRRSIESSSARLPTTLDPSPSSSSSSDDHRKMVDAKLARALVCCAAAAVVAAALCVSPAAAAKGKNPAALPGVKECGEAMDVLSDCLDFVTPWSNASAPPASCCEGIKAVAKLNPWCLCTVLQESHKMDVQVDMARADELPAACHADVPDLGECKDYGAAPAADGPAVASDDGDQTASDSSSSAPPATAVPPEASTASTPTAGGPVSGSDETVLRAPTATSAAGAPAPAPSASAAAAAISSYCATLAAGLAVVASLHL